MKTEERRKNSPLPSRPTTSAAAVARKTPPAQSRPIQERVAQSSELREAKSERNQSSRPRFLEALDKNFRDPIKPGKDDWSQGDEKKLDQALTGEKKFEHVDDFHQGSESNCASIAVMKSAMDTFGNQVFEDVKRQPDGSYEVTMRDGYTTNVSPEELEKAAAAGDFKGAESQQESYATLMWAAMANRGADENFEDAESYDEALHALQNGAVTKDVPQLLGLQDYMQDVKPEDVPNTDAVVGIARRDGGGHAVYIDKGQVDLWGNSEDFDPGGFENGENDYDYKEFFTFSETPQPKPSFWEKINPLNWFS